MHRITTLLAVMLLAMSNLAVAESATVSAYEIKLFINGKTANCVKTKDNSTCDTYFAEDGSLKRFTPADGKTKTGDWWVDEEGKLNVRWTGRKKSMRFDVIDPGDGTWQLIKGKKLKSVITGVRPGDHVQ